MMFEEYDPEALGTGAGADGKRRRHPSSMHPLGRRGGGIPQGRVCPPARPHCRDATHPTYDLPQIGSDTAGGPGPWSEKTRVAAWRTEIPSSSACSRACFRT